MKWCTMQNGKGVSNLYIFTGMNNINSGDLSVTLV